MQVSLFQIEHLSNEELVKLANQGSEEAENLLITRFKPVVKQRARSYFLFGSEKEDLIQEGLIGFYGAVKKFNKQKDIPFKVFADICITRSLISAIKRYCRLKHSPLNRYVSVDFSTSDDFLCKKAIDPLTVLLKKEGEKVLAALMRLNLSKFEKQVLTNRLKGLTYRQIAKKFKKKEKTVDNAIQRIRNKAKLIRIKI
jgi:RNA polymerase sporulation-specific sigma factor